MFSSSPGTPEEVERKKETEKGMIALLTIHYHSLETLCIQSDGGRVEVVVKGGLVV